VGTLPLPIIGLKRSFHTGICLAREKVILDGTRQRVKVLFLLGLGEGAKKVLDRFSAAC